MSLTNKDDEAVVFLWGALVQSHLLVGGGQSSVGGAGGAGLTSPPVGRPPPQTETPPETSWDQQRAVILHSDANVLSFCVLTADSEQR